MQFNNIFITGASNSYYKKGDNYVNLCYRNICCSSIKDKVIKMMTYNDVDKYFKDLQDVDPPITAELISKGYRQKRGGYISDAKNQNISNPTQWWHITHYCKAKIGQGKGEEPYPYTPCGELLIYMAEVSKAVEEKMLRSLVEEIVNSSDIDNRRKWNNEIKKLCWESIKEKIGNCT